MSFIKTILTKLKAMNNGKYEDVKDIIISSIRAGDKNVVACKKAGISQETFYKWFRENSEFSDNVKKARAEFLEEIASQLEDSLWKRAKGFDFEETKTEFAAGVDGKPVIIRQTKTKKHIAPDTGALIFALTNVDPDNWKNRQDNRLSVDDSVTGFKINIVKGEDTPPIANSENDIEC